MDNDAFFIRYCCQFVRSWRSRLVQRSRELPGGRGEKGAKKSSGMAILPSLEVSTTLFFFSLSSSNGDEEGNK
ncbi:hypothetical protein DTO166G4_8544 [Paecilomyces variotii]|nr:hypothetical protein DTO164E3_6106 [Paecilomyces variotii]KAJ9209855.1 hypothetical protein DTO166G4_8544 [Paecilomyces variotii]KAJ9229072.1 hypothetical protein DTO166G5_8154 [Paecilomyces variotii]KAJ9363018.1 hypothetical protein DTO280E4_3053 [Paecilomyces variotii]